MKSHCRNEMSIVLDGGNIRNSLAIGLETGMFRGREVREGMSESYCFSVYMVLFSFLWDIELNDPSSHRLQCKWPTSLVSSGGRAELRKWSYETICEKNTHRKN